MSDPYDDFDEFDEFDELEFTGITSARRMISERQRHEPKPGGRKHRRRAITDRWNNNDWDHDLDYLDYDEDEFDEHYGIRTDH